jgi:hypothetical protein
MQKNVNYYKATKWELWGNYGDSGAVEKPLSSICQCGVRKLQQTNVKH